MIGWGSLTSPRRKQSASRGQPPPREPCALILSDAVTIMTHTYNGGRVTWVSVGNYLKCDIAKMARAAGVECGPRLGSDAAGVAWQIDCRTDAIVIGEFFRTVMTRFMADDGGHWRTTAAQLSHQTYRRRFCGRDLVEHREPSAAKLERAAVFGARSELRYYGGIGKGINDPSSWYHKISSPHESTMAGPVYKFDVRSQYPAIMRDCKFPVALDRPIHDMSVDELHAVASYRCVIARVKIKTDLPIYPFRHKGHHRIDKAIGYGKMRIQDDYIPTRIIYPVGEFWTDLCGPEIIEACKRGHIVAVGSGWEYRPGKPFEAYMNWLIDDRQNARDENDECRETMRKLQANSFAGKWASRGGKWVNCPDVIPAERWGEWHEIDADTVEPMHYRAISGVVQRYEKDDDEPKGFPSIFAYLTSYGRVQLWQLMESAGIDNVIWCNTDGLLVTKKGRDNLYKANAVGNGEAGRLRYEGEIHDFVGFTPRHYFADGQWTLAGTPAEAVMLPGGRFAAMQGGTLSDLLASPERTNVGYARRYVSLPTRPTDGSVNAQGWLVPAVVGPKAPTMPEPVDSGGYQISFLPP